MPGIEDEMEMAGPEGRVAAEAMETVDNEPEGGGDWGAAYQEAFGGGGAPSSGGRPGRGANWTKILLILAVLGIILIIGYWFFAVGGGQATAGIGSVAGRGIGAIFDSFAIRSFMNTLSNPFGISPTSGQYEDVQDTKQKTGR